MNSQDQTPDDILMHAISGGRLHHRVVMSIAAELLERRAVSICPHCNRDMTEEDDVTDPGAKPVDIHELQERLDHDDD